MKLSLVAASVFLAVACSGPYPASSPSKGIAYTNHESPTGVMPEVVPVYVDKRFTDAHKAEIHSAFDQWTKVLNGYESFTIATDEFDMELSIVARVVTTGQGLIVMRRLSTDPIMEDMDEGVLGWVSMDPGVEAHVMNLVEDVIGNRDMSAISLHEIGHTLRLPHLPVKGTTLYPSYRYGAPCVDEFSVRLLAMIRGFDWQKMNYCRYPPGA